MLPQANHERLADHHRMCTSGTDLHLRLGLQAEHHQQLSVVVLSQMQGRVMAPPPAWDM